MRNENQKALIFAFVVSIVSALILAGTVQLLKPRQEFNFRVDVKKNILLALQISGDMKSDVAVEELYDKSVKEIVVNKQGEVIEGLKPSDLEENEKERLPVYQAVVNGQVQAICIPVSGKGLWSTIYGYLAFENDFNTVKGITFYKHGETAGLGADIDTDWFQKRWQGKKIMDEQGNLVSVQIKKGSVVPDDPMIDHLVDGIAGATMTTNGVNDFILEDLKTYQEYFKKGRSNG
ncbi:MAG: NADH:ubiquinone reductase (Na(+)-transporting) subunit C [Fibrobacter sp.]|nr:NADH:ubiquinone reductase (Na(+)-transporting) subunit C [Fibrobacter sp.]